MLLLDAVDAEPVIDAVSRAVHAWIAFGRRPPSEREIELEVARLQDAG